MSQPFDFLDDSNPDERSVSFGISTMLLEDDEDDAPGFFPRATDSSFSHSNTATNGPATTNTSNTSHALDDRASPVHRTLADMHGPASRRPPTQPSTFGLRRHPSRSVSSIELAAIMNGSAKRGGHAAPSSSVKSGRERVVGSNLSDKKASVNPHWPKSVFDMIQDDFPRTPSPMLSSLVPSKSVGTAHELRNAKLHPRIPSAQRRTRAVSSAALDVDYDIFGKSKNGNTEVTRESNGPNDDFDAIFGPSEDTRQSTKRISPSRGHRRSVSINWTGDIPGLLEDRSSNRSALKASQSSILFPTIGDCPSPPEPAQNAKNPSDVAGHVTPPHNSISAATSAANPRSASPLNSQRSPVRHSTESYADAELGQISSSSGMHHSNYTGANDANVHMQPLATEQGASDFDFNYLYDRQDPQFTHQANPMLGGSPHVQASPAPAYSPGGFPAGGFSHPNGFGAPGGPSYAHTFRDNMAAADNLKTMSMQMAMFFHQQQQMYAAQMAQMAALTGTPFNAANIFNTPNPNNMFGVPGMQQQNNSTHHRSPWDSRESPHRGNSRASRGYGDSYESGGSRKKDGPGGKSRGGRGRRGNRSHDDGASGRLGGGGNLGGGVMDNHVRSPLLEDFRATSVSIGRGMIGGDQGLPGSFGSIGNGGNGSPGGAGAREWSLSEIKDHVVEFATDQHGSRFIQQKLEAGTKEEKLAVLNEAMSEAQRLMTDVFGNYVVQKLLDHGGDIAVETITTELEGRMLSLSLHMYGCRVVQKALEVVESERRAKLVRELDGHVLKCIRDQNGNHVIQKCIELVESDAVQFIVDAVLGQAVTLAGHSYGCRVVQRILEHGAPHQKDPIMVEIMAAISDLIKDQYGNYVIQHVVEHGDSEERGVIMRLVRSEVATLSQHKFASNVVERCLQFGSMDEREILVEMLTVGDGGASPLNHLVRDQFGNYVVQRVLDVAKPAQRERVAAILKTQVPAIKKYSYGKHIIARLEDGAAFAQQQHQQ